MTDFPSAGHFDRRIRIPGEPGSGGPRTCPAPHAFGDRAASVFDELDHFKIDRSPNDHLALGGYGRHHCIDPQLARLEPRVLLEELLTRLHDLEFVDPEAEPPRRSGNFVLGIESLPIRYTIKPRRGR